MDPLFIIYLAGFLWFWRYHVGFVFHELSYGTEPDSETLVWGLVFGTLGTTVWPVTVFGRSVYALWMKYIDGSVTTVGNFLPKPKEIETADERRERKAREESDKIDGYRKAVNDRERELEMPLTTWEVY